MKMHTKHYNQLKKMKIFTVTTEIESDGEEWEYRFNADDFAHAEEQAIDYLSGIPEKIVRIELVREA